MTHEHAHTEHDGRHDGFEPQRRVVGGAAQQQDHHASRREAQQDDRHGQHENEADLSDQQELVVGIASGERVDNVLLDHVAELEVSEDA